MLNLEKSYPVTRKKKGARLCLTFVDKLESKVDLTPFFVLNSY